VDNHHRDYALQPGMPHATLKATLPTKVAPKAFEELMAELVTDGQLAQRGEWIARRDFSPKPTDIQEQLLKKLEKVYRDAGVEAKGRVDMLTLAGTPENQVDSLLAFLFANGTLVRLNDDTFMHKEAYGKALHALKEHFAGKETLTLAEFRDRIGSARKQTQAILELFDSLKYTMRKGDERVAWQLPE
jgi:selenocysteine-specific elongation factor